MLGGAAIIFAGLLFRQVFRLPLPAGDIQIGVAEYGLLSLGMAAVNIVTRSRCSRWRHGLTRFVPLYRELKQPEKERGAIKFALGFGMLLSPPSWRRHSISAGNGWRLNSSKTRIFWR